MLLCFLSNKGFLSSDIAVFYYVFIFYNLNTHCALKEVNFVFLIKINDHDTVILCHLYGRKSEMSVSLNHTLWTRFRLIKLLRRLDKVRLVSFLYPQHNTKIMTQCPIFTYLYIYFVVLY